jgi:hypothetical protein
MSDQDWQPSAIKIGAVVEVRDVRYICTKAWADGRCQLSRIPDGQTVAGMGSAWQIADQPTRIVQPFPPDLRRR